MTRQEFVDDVTSFWDLIDFCNENGCDLCEDIVVQDAMDDWVWDDIRDWNGSWESLADALSGITQGHEYYRRHGSLDYEWMDGRDFEAYKADVLDWADDSNAFDEEEPEEPEDGPDGYDDGYWYTDPVTGQTFVAGARITTAESPEFDAFLMGGAV